MYENICQLYSHFSSILLLYTLSNRMQSDDFGHYSHQILLGHFWQWLANWAQTATESVVPIPMPPSTVKTYSYDQNLDFVFPFCLCQEEYQISLILFKRFYSQEHCIICHSQKKGPGGRTIIKRWYRHVGLYRYRSTLRMGDQTGAGLVC